MNELQAALTGFAGRKRAEAIPMAEAAESLPATESTNLPSLDPATMAELRSLNTPETPGLFQELTHCFLADFPKVLSRLHEARAKEDLQKVHQLAHTLKGSSANMGALRVAELCRKLEQECLTGDAGEVILSLDKEFQRVRDELLVELSR